MASVLLLYGTGEGQTATVAERMAAVIEASGHDVAVLNEMPSAFFSLGLSATGGGEGQAAEDLVGEFLDETDFAFDRTLTSLAHSSTVSTGWSRGSSRNGSGEEVGDISRGE